MLAKKIIPTRSDWASEISFSAAVGDWLVLTGIALFALATLICPIVRAFYRLEINYNEGWNVYNVARVVQHVPLYGARYAWTTVNYPVLSFYVVACLSHFTHNYLFTMRFLSIISLAVSCVLVALIVRRLTGEVVPAFFAGFFCLGLFCTHATRYVGMADPQMFAQVFFLSGFLLYISLPTTLSCLAAVAFLFIVGGNIKHNLIGFPLAVFIHLCLVSPRKAVQFVLISIPLAAASVLLNIKLGGPYFISNLLGPRGYSALGAIGDFLYNYAPILLPFLVALIWVFKNLGDPSRRLICILFLASLIVDVGFAGGVGISINTYFGNFLALSIVLGMFLQDVWHTAGPFPEHRKLWRRLVSVLLCLSLILTLFLSGYFRIWNRLKLMPVEQSQFDAETSYINAQAGPAICESLLRCYYAGKQYEFDPFNSTRLVLFHKLDGGEIVRKIQAHQYGAIQLDAPVGSEERPNERFPDAVLDAISQYYVVGFQGPHCAIYIPSATHLAFSRTSA